ncbi:DNA excision repair protein ERCC-1 isoform X1 [Neodiprion pinetum]|uniref:DNA excision repair protein ERCC-1 isoform X1 n=1 Tax=Neodiprion lecontei TaxID=441921 RepID=A0A6J0CEM4_NEOLC|nr:DNA excision repair protein ERCC-1 isoform X1 [Neodiprion lecontei]XP_046473287.1 DNA excision repair protein ERCC-1 isoform X1 [Neodiprion pinetum]
MDRSKQDADDTSSPPKQPKVSSTLGAAFTNLKKSEFFKEDLPQNNVAGPSKPKGALKLNAILVSPKQKGNPLLKSITSVPWEFDDIVPDYVMGRGTCALFLSIRYHQLNPDYIHDRLKLLGKAYDLRVLLAQVDVAEPHHSLKHLTRICILADLTLMLAWNAEDAGKIIETYKIYENKPPDMIMERGNVSSHEKLINALTSVRSVNKTDAMTLLSTFGSVEKVVKASSEALGLCPGFGLQKAIRLHKTLHEPFLRDSRLHSKKVVKTTTSTDEPNVI